MAFTEHASKKYVDERDALLATKKALAAEAQKRENVKTLLDNHTKSGERHVSDEERTRWNRAANALQGKDVRTNTSNGLREAVKVIAIALGAASVKALAACAAAAALASGAATVSTAPLGEIDFDASVVTDVTFEGLAQEGELESIRDFVQEVSDKVGEMGGSTVAARLTAIEDSDAAPTENSGKFVTSGGVFAALKGKQSAVARELFLNAQADVWLSAECGDDANDGLAPDRAVKSIARAYAAAKAAVDAQTLDGSRQVVVAVDEGVYAAAMITSELASGILYRAVGARESSLVMPMGGTYGPGGSYETAMACVNGGHPRVFEMEGFTFTGFNGDHHYEIAQYQSGIVYGMTLRRCLITGNSPICTKAFVCGTFIDCDITGNTTRLRGDANGDSPFGGYAAVYDDRERYQTRMYGCHVWDNNFSTFRFFAGKIEAKQCLFENSFAAVKAINGEHNTMIADRYTNPLIPPGPSYKKFFAMGSKYFAVIASSADCTTDPFYVETDGYVCVQSAELTEDKVAADASCPSVRSDGSPDFGYRDSGFGRKKTADTLNTAIEGVTALLEGCLPVEVPADAAAKGVTFVDTYGEDQNVAVAIGEGASGSVSTNALLNAASNTVARSAAVAIGAHSVVTNVANEVRIQGVAVGYHAQALASNAIAIGAGAQHPDEAATHLDVTEEVTKVGNATVARGETSIAVGYSAKATGAQSVAVGRAAEAQASGSVQIGPGVNTNANSLAFRNWQLMEGDGQIPKERLVRAAEEIAGGMFSQLERLIRPGNMCVVYGGDDDQTIEPRLDGVCEVEVSKGTNDVYMAGGEVYLEPPLGSRNFDLVVTNIPQAYRWMAVDGERTLVPVPENENFLLEFSELPAGIAPTLRCAPSVGYVNGRLLTLTNAPVVVKVRQPATNRVVVVAKPWDELEL